MNFFESWQSLAHTAISAVLAYMALLVLLRVSGKRTLSKLNAFDLVVTVALGSTLASVITSERLPLANGVLALALLIFLQFLVAWAIARWKPMRDVVKSEPTLLFYGGQFIDSAIRESRLNREEIRAIIRSSGSEDIRRIQAVVLETDGSFSVIPVSDGSPAVSSLQGVSEFGMPK